MLFIYSFTLWLSSVAVPAWAFSVCSNQKGHPHGDTLPECSDTGISLDPSIMDMMSEVAQLSNTPHVLRGYIRKILWISRR